VNGEEKNRTAREVDDKERAKRKEIGSLKGGRGGGNQKKGTTCSKKRACGKKKKNGGSHPPKERAKGPAPRLEISSD